MDGPPPMDHPPRSGLSPTREHAMLGRPFPESPMIDGAADGGDEIPTTEKIMRMFPAMEKNRITEIGLTRDDMR